MKRAGFNTIGSLVHAIVDKPEETSKRQLLKIRSLGQHSADEIMMTLFCYQLRSLSDKEKTEYLAEVLNMNAA